MKKVFVYYSMTGNVDYVAYILKQKMDIDILRINPVKEYPKKGFIKFLWGGKSAVMRESPELNNYSFDASKYDEIIIGTPVWASNFTPPIRTFVKENKESFKNKKVSVITSYSGGGAEKAMNRLKEELNIQDFNHKLILIDPKDRQSIETNKKIDDFIKEFGE